MSVESDGKGMYIGLVLNSQLRKKKCFFFIWSASIEQGLKTDGLVNSNKLIKQRDHRSEFSALYRTHNGLIYSVDI